MNSVQLISPLSTDFSFNSLLQEHSAFLIIGILILFVSVLLRAGKVIVAQTVLLSLFFVITETFSNPLYLALVIVQILFGIWMIWKVKAAIDTSFYRHSEKTHLRPIDITKGGNAGTGSLLY
ncbi:hypothetical protein [Planococcus sp. ISL-110]|uniref:hypothetical protein n=1 Tax=Planococcus sp. ISL-110 TaxID=2819167 RepID=UPI001BEC5BCA|nr:hypothetical protein [Planococcus sp. ISL-110]MBT2569554.1 hypothetical protein [Planococcus sp. ISL-110]